MKYQWQVNDKLVNCTLPYESQFDFGLASRGFFHAAYYFTVFRFNNGAVVSVRLFWWWRVEFQCTSILRPSYRPHKTHHKPRWTNCFGFLHKRYKFRTNHYIWRDRTETRQREYFNHGCRSSWLERKWLEYASHF